MISSIVLLLQYYMLKRALIAYIRYTVEPRYFEVPREMEKVRNSGVSK